MVVLLCGLSGAGKTTLAMNVKSKLEQSGLSTEIIDGDEYRDALCRDLGFSKSDRFENIRRLGFVANRFSEHGFVSIVSAINPYAEARNELSEAYENVKTIFVDCPIDTLIGRDTKGLYRRAMLEDGHPEKISNLTGINDQFDVPETPDLYLNTNVQNIQECTAILCDFIINND